MQKKTKTDYDVTRNMLKTIRTITESRLSNRTLNEEVGFQSPEVDKSDENLKNDVMVVNDVEIKMNSSDEADLTLQDSEKTAISQLIDNFKQQVSQIADFTPGITIAPDQIRLDGSLTDQDISFVFIGCKFFDVIFIPCITEFNCVIFINSWFEANLILLYLD